MQLCNKEFSPYNNEFYIFTASLYYRICILCYIYSGIVIHLTGDMHASLSRTEQVVIPLIMQTSPQVRFISVLMHDFMMPSTYSRTMFFPELSFLMFIREH